MAGLERQGEIREKQKQGLELEREKWEGRHKRTKKKKLRRKGWKFELVVKLFPELSASSDFKLESVELSALESCRKLEAPETPNEALTRAF